MRIWRFHEFGPIENLRLDEAPKPEPAPGEAVVRIRCAAINPADRFLVNKLYPRPGTPPMAVGRDACGVVDAVAPGSAFEPGQRVMLTRSDVGVSRDGTLAEYTLVPEESLAPAPTGWTDEECAAGGLVGLTAWQALVEEGGVREGSNVLVAGASGGVGTAAIQLAEALGGVVVATSRSSEKRARLLEIGADHAVDTDAEDFVDQARAAIDGGKFDVIVDNIAGPHFDEYIALCGFRARICTVGMMSGVDVGFNIGKMIFKRVHICGISVGSQTAEQARDNWTRVVETHDRAGTRPVIDSVFPFEQVQEAFAAMDRGPVGKIIIGPIAPS